MSEELEGNAPPTRLYGQEYDEYLLDDLQLAIERASVDSEDDRFEVWEWVADEVSLMSADWLLELIDENAADGSAAEDHLINHKDLELLALAQTLLDAVRAKVTYRQAGKHIATHHYVISPVGPVWTKTDELA